MTLKATRDKTGHCSRCREDVQTVRPWPHWRKARYAYFGGLGLALCGTPVILADAFILIPTLMIYIAAIGPLNALVARQPTCAQCGGVTESLRPLRLIKSEPGSLRAPRTPAKAARLARAARASKVSSRSKADAEKANSEDRPDLDADSRKTPA